MDGHAVLDECFMMTLTELKLQQWHVDYRTLHLWSRRLLWQHFNRPLIFGWLLFTMLAQYIPSSCVCSSVCPYSCNILADVNNNVIYSFRSDFQAQCSNWFSRFRFHFSINRLHFSSMTLTFDRVKINQHAAFLDQY